MCVLITMTLRGVGSRKVRIHRNKIRRKSNRETHGVGNFIELRRKVMRQVKNNVTNTPLTVGVDVRVLRERESRKFTERE